jgi:hypothetical protein
VQGPLTIAERRSEDLHRYVRVATVSGCDCAGQAAVLTLYDPVLVFVNVDVWTMTGFDCIEQGDGKTLCHLQSWALRPVTGAMLREDEWSRQQAECSRQFSEHVANFVGPLAPRRTARRRR